MCQKLTLPMSFGWVWLGVEDFDTEVDMKDQSRPKHCDMPAGKSKLLSMGQL